MATNKKTKSSLQVKGSFKTSKQTTRDPMQSIYEKGCDDVKDESDATDICAYCATNYKLQPALYVCLNCSPYGRFMCGDCNKHHKKFGLKHDVKDLSAPVEEKRKIQDIGKPTETQPKSLTEEQLNAAKEQINERNKKIIKLENENKKLTDKVKTLEDHNRSKENDLREELETVKRALKITEKELDNFMKKVPDIFSKSSEDTTARNVGQVTGKDAEYSKIKSLEEKLKEKETEIGQLKTKVEKQSEELQQTVQRNKSDISKLNEKITTLTKERDDLNKDVKEMEMTLKNERKHNVLEKENMRLQKLSKVVGAKVMDDNPDITDLSDENRLTKLSEKFLELFDNEWTDAYEESENNNKRETDIIRELYKLLIDINNFCQMLARSHADNIKSSVLSVPSAANGRPPLVVYGRPKTPQIGVTQTRLLKELRKTFAPYLVDSVFQHFVKTKKIDTKGKPKTEKFVKECIKICWLMNAQDPPVVLDTSNVTGNFDDNRFRTYTKSGKTVDYVVWPPVLLHNDGPLLCKGVAQGK